MKKSAIPESIEKSFYFLQAYSDPTGFKERRG
jgi:hypothetical protein